MTFFFLVCIIIFLSIIQSIIGVGLLVFGTPTLLLLGYSFQETLGIVLPASICISALQIFEANSATKEYKKDFNIFCLPFVLIGVVIVLLVNEKLDFGILVGVMLVITAFIRFFKVLENYLSRIIKKYGKVYQAVMGLLHGLTNMGGGPLALYSSSVHGGDKKTTRAGIAYGYFFMGIIQYGVLIFIHPDLFRVRVLLFCLIAIGAYFLFGKRLYKITGEVFFKNFVNGVIFFYGAVLLINRL